MLLLYLESLHVLCDKEVIPEHLSMLFACIIVSVCVCVYGVCIYSQENIHLLSIYFHL